MMKTIPYFVVFLALLSARSFADEGMWLPQLFSRHWMKTNEENGHEDQCIGYLHQQRGWKMHR